jgi:hypothetical protein
MPLEDRVTRNEMECSGIAITPIDDVLTQGRLGARPMASPVTAMQRLCRNDQAMTNRITPP